MLKRAPFPCAAFFLAVIVISGCGYQIQKKSSLPFSEIKVGLIENRTLEPKLQDRLHRAITREFLKQGVGVTPAAKLNLTGVVKNFQMISLSEKAGVSVEYRIVVEADFRLLDEAGKVITQKNISSPFIISFPASEDMGNIIAFREVAEERAAEDIAMELAGALIYK